MAGKHKYAAVLAIASVAILVGGSLLKPKPPQDHKKPAPEITIMQAEMQRLQEVARRNNLRNLGAQFSSVASSAANSLLFLPESRQSAILAGGELLVPRAIGQLPTSLILSNNAGKSLRADPVIWHPGAPVAFMRPVEETTATPAQVRPLDSLTPGQWTVLVVKKANGEFLFYPGVYSGTISGTCGSIRGPQIQVGIPLASAMLGGGLFDTDGALIGMGVECESGPAILPVVGLQASLADTQRTVTASLESTLGLTIISPDDSLRLLLALRPGLLITRVWNGWPAANAGLEPGDNILSIDGQPVTRAEDLNPLLNTAINRTIPKLKVQRGRRLNTIPFSPAPAEPALTLQRPAEGVVLAEVPLGSAAAKAGLRPGDCVLSVNGAPTELAAVRKKLTSGPLAPAFLVVERGPSQLGIYLHE